MERDMTDSNIPVPNILVVYTTTTEQEAKALQAALHQKKMSSDLLLVAGDDLHAATEHLKTHASEYQAVTLMNLVDYRQIRESRGPTSNGDVAHDIINWASQVQGLVPNVMIYDDLGELGVRRMTEFANAGVMLLNVMVTSPAAAAAAIASMLRPKRFGTALG
jgi:hypothetical protein